MKHPYGRVACVQGWVGDAHLRGGTGVLQVVVCKAGVFKKCFACFLQQADVVGQQQAASR
jgi:hypothetical protein